MAEKKFSDLTTASQINETDIAAISQENNGVWGSFKATIGAIAQKIITGINFATAFNTNAKTVAGAVNEKLTSNAVADIEVSPAESAHSEGDYLIYNGLLYLVIDDIAIGDALATGAGGNIEIAQIADGIGGAGHDILNDAGSTLPKEGKLQFVGVYVHDDSINGKTVVENYREMTAAEYALLNSEQKKGLINVTDEQGHPITASATGFDNTGTSFEGDNVQDVLEEVDGLIEALENNVPILNGGTVTDLDIPQSELEGNSILKSTYGLATTHAPTTSAGNVYTLTNPNKAWGRQISVGDGGIYSRPLNNGAYPTVWGRIAEIKRVSFDVNTNNVGQVALYTVLGSDYRIPMGLTITSYASGYNRSFLSSISGNVVLNAYKQDGTAFQGNVKGYYYFISDTL